MIVTASIFLRGDELDPSAITRIVGISPTKAHSRGERVGASETRKSLQRTGTWTWSSQTYVGETAVKEATAALLAEVKIPLLGLEGVADAWVDFLILISQDEAQNETVFSLNASDCAALGRIGLPAYFTVGRLGSGTER